MSMRFPLSSWSRRALLAAFALSLLALGSASSPAPSQGVAKRAAAIAPYERGVIVVGFKAGVSGAASHAALERAGIARASTPPDPFVTVTLRGGVSMTRAIAALRERPAVAWAVPDYIAHAAQVEPAPFYPNDPGAAGVPRGWEQLQWNFVGTFGVDAPQAWANLRAAGHPGGEGVIVAVLDTGVAYADHGRFVRSPDFRSNEFVQGYDFVSHGPYPEDHNGHGTQVAGTIAEATNNGVGVTGLDWACRIQPVRALGIQHGTGVDSDIADAIRWAAGLHVEGVPDNATPADVINMSFGGKGASSTMQAAINDALARGAVVVAAAGNLAYDAGGDSPAGLDGVITVGGVDPTGQIASYSNFGRVVSLMAPGGVLLTDAMGNSEGILSTLELPGTGYTYAYYAGTSQATPFVSAAVALMKSVYPSMTPAEAKKLLMASADPASRCANPTDPSAPGCGAGLLDVDAAVVLASTQSQCVPGCGDGLVCSANQCVSASSIAGGVTGETNVTYGGCSATGRTPGDDALCLAAALMVALVLSRRSRV